MQLYEQTKPQDQQVIAAIKKRNRTRFRWGTSNSTAKSSTAQASSSKSSRSSSSKVSSSNPPAATSGVPSSNSGRRSHSPWPQRLKPTLAPIIESELEDHVADDEEEDGEEEGGHGTASPASSDSSSLSLPAGSQYALSLSSPDASFTCNSPKSTSSSSPEEDQEEGEQDALKHQQQQQQRSRYKPRVEYNLRKLLRQVMGLDGVWSCDQQVARHYTRIKWGVVKTQADGNCLFRAISDQLYGSEIFHGDIRRRIVEFIQREGKLFQPFIATEEGSGETLEQYCKRMKKEGEWGGNPELYAAAKLFNIHIVVHQGPMRRVRIENGRDNDPKTGKPPVPYKILHLLYKDDHYNSLRPSPEEDKAARKEKTRKAAAPKQKQKAKTEDELGSQETAATVVKRDRSPASSPQNSRRQAKTHKIQDKDSEKAQEMGGDSHARDRDAAESKKSNPEKVEVEVEVQEEEQPAVTLCAGLRAVFEEEDPSVAVSKPARVTFRRGKAHSVCSSDDGSVTSTSSSEASVPTSPPSIPTRKQSTAEPPAASAFSETSAPAVVKAIAVDAADTCLPAEEEAPSTRAAFPNRLKFHRGVQQQQQQEQPMTTAC